MRSSPAHEGAAHRARPRPEPHLDRAPLVPRAPRPVRLGRRDPQQLALRVRRARLDSRSALRPLVPALLLSRAARPGLAQPGRACGDRRGDAVLARARRRRLPRGRGRAHLEGPRAPRRPAGAGAVRAAPPRRVRRPAPPPLPQCARVEPLLAELRAAAAAPCSWARSTSPARSSIRTSATSTWRLPSS